MGIRITRLYGTNTDTRQAYYQMFRIQDTRTGRGAVLFNYGPLDTGGKKELPISHGSSQIKTGTTFRLVSDIWTDTLRAKRKSGYKFGTEDILSDGDYRGAIEVMKQIFKAGQIASIEKALLPDEEPDDEHDDTIRPDPAVSKTTFDPITGLHSMSPNVDPDYDPEPEPRHEAWGTW